MMATATRMAMAMFMWLSLLAGSAAGAEESQLDRIPQLDGCRYVFLDVGSNIGIHVRFLFEPELYPKQGYTGRFFDKYFPRENRITRSDICVVGFEPNPHHRKRLERLEEYYRSKGLRCYWVFAGVADKNSQMTFVRRKDKHNMLNSEWGFHIIARAERNKTRNSVVSKSKKAVGMETEDIEIIRFADFLDAKILNRQIPEPRFDSDPPPAVLAKIDIEMEEYAVMNDILKEDSHWYCGLSVVSIEYHYYNHNAGKVGPVPKGHVRTRLPEIEKVEQRIGMATSQPNCTTKLVEFDTEDYRHDNEKGLKLLRQGL